MIRGCPVLRFNRDLRPEGQGGPRTVSAAPTGQGGGKGAPFPGSVLALTGVDTSFPAPRHGILVVGHSRGFQDL